MPKRRYPTQKKTATSTKAGVEKGFRSGLEDLNAHWLLELDVPVIYEQHVLQYEQPAKVRKYTPDFILPNGIVVETKGWFNTEDRQKHLMVKVSHPHLDLRFVFANPHQRISKQSQTTYAMWCNHKGFEWAHKHIPRAWVEEAPQFKRIDAAKRAFGWVDWIVDRKK